jgi:uncharacterized protein YqgV (UPF0045/DUF77 family)
LTVKLTAELSLYPLCEDYITAIGDFIAAANEHRGLEIVTNAMSTQICGDYDQVFALLRQELRRSYDKYGKQVLVCKLFPGELAILR